jgi:hypothetical protein
MPKVRQLEWVRRDEWQDPTWEVADTIVGRYEIAYGYLQITTIMHGSEETIAMPARASGDRKAAAQADYEQRILSALEDK